MLRMGLVELQVELQELLVELQELLVELLVELQVVLQVVLQVLEVCKLHPNQAQYTDQLLRNHFLQVTLEVRCSIYIHPEYLVGQLGLPVPPAEPLELRVPLELRAKLGQLGMEVCKPHPNLLQYTDQLLRNHFLQAKLEARCNIYIHPGCLVE